VNLRVLGKRTAMLVLAAAVIAGAWFAGRALMTRRTATLVIASEVVATRDIAQTVEATGTVQPVEVVEIKSKASGQILSMPVELGSVVRAGDLLAQIDTVTVQNQYNQSLAALQAAQADVEISGAQRQRADELFSRAVLTADQHESAVLASANAQSALARARSDLEIARQALHDATVRAPSAGTIIQQDVTKGQVIASATSSASGGTTLLKMADLNRVQMQALVGETDIGNVRPGQSATVTVDAFPNRPFRGQVVKIQPQAVIQQAVTMFPVLIAISNENGLLLPGMNGEVTVSIEERTGVVAVPLDAVRTVRELPTLAAALGMNVDSLRAQIQRQSAARAGRRDSASPDSARARAWQGAGGGGGRGGRGELARTRGAFGGAAGGGTGGRGAPQGAAGDSAGRAAMGGGNGRSAQLVFIKTPQGFEPRLVRLGISDFDYAEVLRGVSEGDEVALLSVAEAQAKRQQDLSRARQRVGTGMPGVSAGGGGGRTGGGGR
jgi:HlyD family secretion protein